jgi:putative transposase
MATIRQQLSTYAILLLTHQRLRHFQRTAHADLFLNTLLRYRAQAKFRLHAFVIMPDRVHLLITPAIDQSTSRCIQPIRGGYSFAIRGQFPGESWHSGYNRRSVEYPARVMHELLAEFLVRRRKMPTCSSPGQ